jgi:hypothetical protein
MPENHELGLITSRVALRRNWASRLPLTTDFTEQILLAIDDTVHELLGQRILDSLHAQLRTHYGISPEELPYRLDALYDVLEKVSGAFGVKTIGHQVAKNLYVRLGLRFVETENYTLHDYIEQAKRTLSK